MRLIGHHGAIGGLAFAPAGATLVSTAQDGLLKLWSLEPRKLQTVRCNGPDGWVTGVGPLPDGQRFLSSSWDGTLRLWELATGKELAVWEGHTDKVQALALSPDGKRALSVGSDKTV